jgi:hypothetical protein
MGRTACTEPQCLYKGALYLYLTVELYLHSPYGPYGLYRASVPVQRCTLPVPYSRAIPLLPLWTVRPLHSLSACTRVQFTFLLSINFSVSSNFIALFHFYFFPSFLLSLFLSFSLFFFLSFFLSLLLSFFLFSFFLYLKFLNSCSFRETLE